MNEDIKSQKLINEYLRKIELIHRRYSVYRRGISRFKEQFKHKPDVMNVNIMKNLFGINNDYLKLEVFEQGIKDLEERQYTTEGVRKGVFQAIAQINREIAQRRVSLNKVIVNFRRNIKKIYNYSFCSSCTNEIEPNQILCVDCAENIGVLDYDVFNCEECGKIIPDNAKFCPGCGKTVVK